MKKSNPKQVHPNFSWSEIDTVFLDMDGTLLDKYFDDYFWEEYVPKIYAEQNDLSDLEAHKSLLSRYQRVENTLQWTDLDYWTEQLGLDIPLLKRNINNLIQVHPYVIDYFTYMKSIGKTLHLITNAHSKTLAIKMEKTSLSTWFDSVICAEEVGEAKEHPLFWEKLVKFVDYDRNNTLLVDDTEKVLLSAHTYGIGTLISVAKPSSRLPIRFSTQFPSIINFKELIF